jgi:hypothetical protein
MQTTNTSTEVRTEGRKLWSGAKALMEIYGTAEKKTLAERADAVTADTIDTDPAEFFAVLVSKGLNTNRTSL